MKDLEYTNVEKSMMEYANMLERMARTCEALNAKQEQKSEMADILGHQLVGQANVLKDKIQKHFHPYNISKQEYGQLQEELQSIGISLQELSVQKIDENTCNMKLLISNVFGINVTAMDVAGVLTEVMKCPYKPVGNCRTLINSNINEYTFSMAQHFQVVCGVAKCSKYPQSFSGDNYYIENLDNGKVFLCLSDGMGTGREAWEKSRLVVELMMDAIRIGFSVQNAIELINMVLAVNDQNGLPVTLDLCVIDLKSGVADFVKLGAVATFILRKEWIEMIQSETMPMGVLECVDFDYTVKKLYAGDYVVMITDGVLESIPGLDKEKAFLDVLENVNSKNPQSIADYVMHWLQQYAIKDDITIIVAGIYE